MATGGRKMAGDIVERTFFAGGGQYLFDDDYYKMQKNVSFCVSCWGFLAVITWIGIFIWFAVYFFKH